MKSKILIMLLVVVLVGGGVAAYLTLGGGLDLGAGSASAGSLYDIANNSSATAITTSISYAPGGDNMADVFGGWYEIKRSGNNMIVDYQYNRYRTVSEGAEIGEDSRFIEEKGIIYYLDGKYYNHDDETKTPWVDLPLDAGFKFKIDKAKLTSIKSTDSNSVTAKMSKEACLEMFGLELAAEGDISLSIITNGVQLTELEISYVTTSGATVKILTTYSYNDLTLDFTPVIGEEETEEEEAE